MKILFVTNIFPNPNGPRDGIYLFWRAKTLIQKGHQVSVLKWNQQLKDVNQKAYNILNINDDTLDENISVMTIHTIQNFNPLFRKKLYNKIKAEYDIVHFHFLWSMAVLPEIKKWGIPFVVTCHGSDINRLGEGYNSTALGRWINKKITRMQLLRLSASNHAIFVSTALKNAAVNKGFVPTECSVIPNGYSPIYLTVNINQKNRLPVVGFVGLLTHIKRADKLPEIFQLILNKIDVDHFLVISDGYLKNQLKQDVSNRRIDKYVRFVGNVPPHAVADFMSTMDVFILPSRMEAWGCVIKEAQACGASVVGSSNGGIPLAIGRGGIVVDEGDNFESRFADAVVRLIQSPIDPVILKEEVQDYTWEKIVSKEISIYQDILRD